MVSRVDSSDSTADGGAIVARPSTCALEDCDRPLPSAPRSNQSVWNWSRQIYCCDEHKSLACVRRRRARLAASTPALLSGAICPIDGRIFPIEMFARRGRPRRYDCETCRMIAREMRESDRLMRSPRPSTTAPAGAPVPTIRSVIHGARSR